MYLVYILYSASIDKYYIGQTEDVERRLSEHRIRNNLGAKDWILRHKETFETRTGAVNREKEIKAKKRRSYLEYLIASSK
jgi:putative endonuclease